MAIRFEVAHTEEDARDVVALHAAIAEHHARAIEGARPWRAPDLRRVLALVTSETTIMVRDTEEALVGSFRLDPARGFCGIAPFTEVPRFVYLFEMAIRPSHQRRGVGRLCLAEAERWSRARGAAAIRTDTNADAVTAARFYEACGYRRVLHHAETIYLERLL